MLPIVAIVGHSNSGKTRVATYLVQSLAREGYRVAAIKHCHLGHQVDKSDSDTYRLYGSGAVAVIASSPGQRTRIDRVRGDLSLECLADGFKEEVDLILAEGFKHSNVPKILVVKDETPPPTVENVLAVVGDTSEKCGAPSYTFDELPALAELVRSQVLNPPECEASILLTVDGVEVPLSRYPSAVLRKLAEGFVASLNGVPAEPQEIRITVRGRGAGDSR